MSEDQTPNLDAALFALTPEGLGSGATALGRSRLRTFLGLRWIAVAGQTAAVLIVVFLLNFQISLALCLAIIAASAWLNVALAFAFRSQRLMRSGEVAAHLAFDVCQLAALIAATGGLSNPFLLLLLAPVIVAAAGQRPALVIGIAALTLVLAASMPLYALPLPWTPGSMLELPPLFQLGHFVALAVGLSFCAVSALRVTDDEARLVRALDAAQVVMAREQRLSALGAMAAMTAHELGTPLGTIHLVAREMAQDIPPDSPLHEDARLLAEQAERCRTILGRLAQEREAGDIVHANMPLRAVLEEASAPFRGLGVSIDLKLGPKADGAAKIPILRRSPEVLHALGAFIENAVSFAETGVLLNASWSADELRITVLDDGPGFSRDVLPKLGEPYVSQRGEAQAGGGDMGLGFFIAKTLIERTGGVVAMRNRAAPDQGAIVQATWPLAALAADEESLI